MKSKTTKPVTTTGAAIVRAALHAHTAAEAAQVNDMIQMHVGARHERFVGDTASNLGPLSTPGSYDHKALEPVTNMLDAILERLARERFGDDLSAVPYKTPAAAAKALLGNLTREEQAKLARVDIYESDPPTSHSKRVTLTYRDQGCGIANAYVGESIFRIGSRHKDANLWQQGAFGIGATTTYPNAQAVVLLTRRPSSLLESGEEDVITVAVAEWQQHQKGRGIYYLVTEATEDNLHAAPLTVPASEVPEFEPGTYLALVSYATDGFHYTSRNDRRSLEFIINTRLWRSPMPVTLMNHVAKGDHPKIHQGRGEQFDAAPRKDRREFHDVMPFRMNGQTHHLPIDVFYFEGGHSGDVGSMRNFIAQGHSTLLLANGQAHKHWDRQELRNRADRLTKLYDRILVVAYLDEIPVDQRTSQLFSPDRVDLVSSPDAKRLQDSIAAMLNSWSELRKLNKELVRKAIQDRGSDRSTLEIAKKIQAQLAFRGGVSLTGSDKGDNPPPKRKWADADLWPDPTTLEGSDKVRAIPGKTRFLHFQINARDEFFSSGRGSLELTCDHPRIGSSELVAGGELHGGMIRASLLVPDDVTIGDTATITARVRNWMKAAGGLGDDLEWTCQLEIVDGTRKQAKSKSKTNKGGAGKGSQVAVLWRKNDDREGWTGGVPGEIEMVEASVLAAERDEYKHLTTLGSEPVPTVVLNVDYSPLKRYEAERTKKHNKSTLDQARDRYGVGVGVGLLVLEERYRKLEKEGKKRPTDTLAEGQAVARAALALMPDFDLLIQEAGLEIGEPT